MPSRNLTPWSRSRGQLSFDPLLDLHREMDRLFNDAFSGFTGGTLADVRGGGLSAPRVDVREKDGELCVMAELPGVSQQDLDLQLDGDVLTIRGEKKNETEEDNANYYMMERSYGRFERSVQLPFTPKPEDVKANFENGVLRITMPKTQNQGAHRISLNPSGEQQGSGQHQVSGQQSAGTGKSGSAEKKH